MACPTKSGCQDKLSLCQRDRSSANRSCEEGDIYDRYSKKGIQESRAKGGHNRQRGQALSALTTSEALASTPTREMRAALEAAGVALPDGVALTALAVRSVSVV